MANKSALITICALLVTLTGCSTSSDAVKANNSNPATTSVAKTENSRKTYTRADDDIERKNAHEVAYFAAGCFWGVEDVFKTFKGVLDTTVGYTGGNKENPTYEDVCSHGTKHAEAVRVVFDPKVVTYKSLVLDFLKSHDPTTLNRQGPDSGDQYRSAVFYSSPTEEDAAKATIAQYQESGEVKQKIVTSLEKFDKFYSAEDYHQDYFAKNGGGSCHIPRKNTN